MLKWYSVVAPGYGQITVKGTFEQQAKLEAAERLQCDVEDIASCVAMEPVYMEDRPGKDFDGRMV